VRVLPEADLRVVVVRVCATIAIRSAIGRVDQERRGSSASSMRFTTATRSTKVFPLQPQTQMA
jgi:hypothetical protein